MQAEKENLGVLATGILRDSKTLIGQEAELFKVEISETWARAQGVIAAFFVSALAAMAATLLISVTLVQLVVLYTEIPLWGASALVAVGFSLLGYGLCRYGRDSLAKLNVLPKETIENIRENLQCLKAKAS